MVFFFWMRVFFFYQGVDTDVFFVLRVFLTIFFKGFFFFFFTRVLFETRVFFERRGFFLGVRVFFFFDEGVFFFDDGAFFF